MENQIKFRVGQRAWSMHSGWGTIVEILQVGEYPIQFKPDANEWLGTYTLSGKWSKHDLCATLYHKEQVFDFSEPDFPKGTLGYFWDDSMKDRAVFGFYSHKSDRGYHYSANGPEYKNFCAYPEIPPQFKDKSKS